MIYNLILVFCLPLAIPVFLLLAAFNPRYRTGLIERLGFWKRLTPHALRLTPSNPVFWIHAASVGEVHAAWPLVEKLSERYPSPYLIFTTLTVTGRTLVEQRLSQMKNKPGVALVRLFPLDLPIIPFRLLRRFRPDLILIIETELWPNFLRTAHRLAIPVAIINGRISPKAFSRYRMIRWILRPRLQYIERFLMQTQGDAERIIHLGAPNYRVNVTGNLKFDGRIDAFSALEEERLKTGWGWSSSDPVWVAGSTHSGEEEQILSIFISLKKDHPDLRLILAPRHLDRIPEIMDLLSHRRLAFGLFSKPNPLLTPHPSPLTPPYDVILVNTMGQLGRLYSLATIVFVGGSMIPVGGHNLAEPALLGKPVLYGPHIQQVQAMADLLAQHGGGIRTADSRSLELEIRILLADPDLRRRMGKQAWQTVREHQGTVSRIMEILSDLLESFRFRTIQCIDQRNMIQRWAEESLWPSRRGGPAQVVSGGLKVLSIFYRGMLKTHEASYRVGILRSRRLSRPVISVGNLVVGGTGKTPTVIAICRLLLQAGHHPVVLSRGYGGRYHAPVLEVSDGEKIKWSAPIVGDEPVLLARRLPGVPVLIGPDRSEVGRAAIAAHHPDILILDDGFQHRRLERDLDLVLLDGSNPFGNGEVLPRGPLREPIRHLERAHAMLITRVESFMAIEGLVSFLHQICPDRPCLLSRHRLTGCVPLDRVEAQSVEGLESLPAKRVFIVTGIARPRAFLQLVARTGLEIAGVYFFPDHYAFGASDVDLIEREANRLGAQAILTTEKDAVRLESLSTRLKAWWAVGMELSVYDPKAWEDLILKVVSCER